MENCAVSVSEEAEKVERVFQLCIICQNEKNENLVKKPNSHEKVLKSIEEWAKYGYSNYSEAWEKLRNNSPEDLQVKQASWHHSCYKDAVHTGMLKRARERYVVSVNVAAA